MKNESINRLYLNKTCNEGNNLNPRLYRYALKASVEIFYLSRFSKEENYPVIQMVASSKIVLKKMIEIYKNIKLQLKYKNILDEIIFEISEITVWLEISNKLRLISLKDFRSIKKIYDLLSDEINNFKNLENTNNIAA